jgi:hypothetical protein
VAVPTLRDRHDRGESEGRAMNKPCINWTGSVNVTGSPYNQRRRHVYEAVYGPAKGAVNVACGNRRCLEPSHLTTQRPECLRAIYRAASFERPCRFFAVPKYPERYSVAQAAAYRPVGDISHVWHLIRAEAAND